MRMTLQAGRGRCGVYNPRRCAAKRLQVVVAALRGNLSIQRPIATLRDAMLLQKSILFAAAVLLCVQGQLPGKQNVIFHSNVDVLLHLLH